MQLSKVSHVTSVNTEARKWSPQDDFVLMLMVGRETYAKIALRLGRSPSAVQRRASNKGYSARQEWRGQKAARQAVIASQRESDLRATAEDLEQYLTDLT